MRIYIRLSCSQDQDLSYSNIICRQASTSLAKLHPSTALVLVLPLYQIQTPIKAIQNAPSNPPRSHNPPLPPSSANKRLQPNPPLNYRRDNNQPLYIRNRWPRPTSNPRLRPKPHRPNNKQPNSNESLLRQHPGNAPPLRRNPNTRVHGDIHGLRARRTKRHRIPNRERNDDVQE